MSGAFERLFHIFKRRESHRTDYFHSYIQLSCYYFHSLNEKRMGEEVVERIQEKPQISSQNIAWLEYPNQLGSEVHILVPK